MSEFTLLPVNLNVGPASTAGSGQVGSSDVAKSVSNLPGASFAEALQGAGENVVASLQNAEAQSIAGLKGEASAYDVASSVMEAEQSLRMTIAVRDRVVQAYLEISRMQI